jgi:hypothetical protein
MNLNKKIALIALSVCALGPASAFAHTDVSIGVNLGGYAPMYEAPEPVYVTPPIYYGPTVIYRNHDWYDREYEEHQWRRHEWREHHWRHHDDDDD